MFLIQDQGGCFWLKALLADFWGSAIILRRETTWQVHPAHPRRKPPAFTSLHQCPQASCPNAVTNPNTCSKALLMNLGTRLYLVKVGFCLLKTSKKGLSVNEFWRVHILFKSAWLWYFYYYFWNHQKRRLLRSLILGLLFSSCTKCFLWSYSGL